MRVLAISAGRGPAEVRQFVAELGPALAAMLVERGLQVEEVDSGPGSARVRFRGEAEVGDLIGTHVLVDPARGRRSRRRWYAGVSLHAEHRGHEPLRPCDVVMTATRAGGPGGQHVNTTASAVRATHRPTGLSVRVSGERSQQQNRRVAMKRLQLQLDAQDRQRAASSQQSLWQSHGAVIRGHAVATWRRIRGGVQCVKTSSRP